METQCVEPEPVFLLYLSVFLSELGNWVDPSVVLQAFVDILKTPESSLC